MFAKESLYINAIKYKTQLKINYKKLSNNDIVETNSSTFVVKDDILGRDIATKINAQQEETENSFISTLLLQDETRLIKKNQPKPKDYVVSPLNDEYNIAVSKNTLFESKNFFEKCGIDFIFSAYHILNLHIEQNPCQNNLVILLFNNQAFCFILNSKGEIIFNKRVDVTAFEEIKQSEFYENEIMGQKLYDEVYALEIYELIKNTIEEFYSITKNVFIEKISILYNLKLISEEQIQQMSDDFMIELSYHPISVDEELFQLSKDSHGSKSFIKPRVKPKSSLKTFFISIVMIALILGVGYYFLPVKELYNQISKINIQENIKEQNVPTIKPINLPDHIEKNSYVETRVLKALELIPYDVVLNELSLERNYLKMDINLLNKDTYIKILQPELLKSYNISQIEFKEENKSPILEATLSAEGLKEKEKVILKDYKDIYIQNEFMPIIRVTEQIKILFPENAIVTFKSSFKSEVVTFNYLVNVVIQKPLEFFELINRLNNELYSINISYPINFIKTEAGIEVEFILQFHQPK